MYTSKELLEIVNHYLDSLAYDRKPASLYEPIKYVLDLGGKRIRPILMLLSYNLYKDNPKDILSAACALETYHNYTLLHDDLMDEAPLRRGQQTVHKKWNDNQAVLSGDSMLVLAYERLAKCDTKHLEAALHLFTETALQIGEGQQYDMEFEMRNDVTVEEYIEMIRLKTSVLLACATKMGAILADASKEDAENLYKFGEQIGLAFQLQDDYLDVYGDAKVFGKKIGGDITSNKKTYMLITAFNQANAEQRAELEKWINKSDFDTEEKIAAVTRLYNEIGVDKLAKEKMGFYYEQGKKFLDAVKLPDERKEALVAYAAEMMKRQR
ncbi:isoprenyl synthetase [Prevotella intermedia ATCC 25611 = DSM 20706]|uniref:polyprenyl synthetase family protein n=1 Tax=Prevotella intermedia TaxID=28131 RepID=UPI0003F94201|nr:polyprenyl synthetase family protein [Prevotella intermedia]APW32956.1 isoprenyl synthetase [Prevotella intermedia ATCC 25611 = DSM 20706]SUB98502.1 Farnesyl diphosphate synthase [Prevotella intermedia]